MFTYESHHISTYAIAARSLPSYIVIMASESTVADRTRQDDKMDEVKAEVAPAAAKESQKKLDKADKKAKAKTKEQQQKPGQTKAAAGGPALIGITNKKEDDISAWYIEVLLKAEMMDYSDVPGFFILEPASSIVWDSIRDFLDPRIKKMGVRPCHFPLFIAEHRLATEKEHLEGFAAEVAWVTHGGTTKLKDRLAVRPTSETAMYPHFAKKITSHRDLPYRRNQWNTVVRWEFKHAIPFLRSREFAWQEGHTAHLTKELAGKEVLEILDHYADIYQELLAVPVVKGTKTDNEKFAGALYTTTVEGFIASSGRGIQGGTSHCLGQHFSKMFDIKVEDPTATEKEPKPSLNVWQNSWGFSTRSIGVMVMVHSDNKGLVMPPRVAEIQVVMVPVGVTTKTAQEDKEALYREVDAMQAILLAAGVRVHVDDRDNYTVGYKFNDWELKGVPLRVEFGPKDREKHQVTLSRRDREEKTTMAIQDIGKDIPALLETIQHDLFKKADDEYRAHRIVIEKWDDFVPALNNKNVCLIRHCLGDKCEEQIKELSARQATAGEAEDEKAPSMGAKSLCIPFEQVSELTGEESCTNPKCEAKAKKWVMFGRSY